MCQKDKADPSLEFETEMDLHGKLAKKIKQLIPAEGRDLCSIIIDAQNLVGIISHLKAKGKYQAAEGDVIDALILYFQNCHKTQSPIRLKVWVKRK